MSDYLLHLASYPISGLEGLSMRDLILSQAKFLLICEEFAEGSASL